LRGEVTTSPSSGGEVVSTIRAAAVQATPVFLDREATVSKVARLIQEAARNGAGLVAFPETFVPTYPEWVWRLPPWDGPTRVLYERLLDQSVVVPGPATEAIGAAARKAKTYVSVGVNEREPHGSTLYNTQLYFGPDGSLLGKHRKLMPTGGERLVWGMGDASTLSLFDTPFGRLGGLICWENYMPLARVAMYGAGIDVWVAATWDDDPVWVSTLQHIAKEGRVHVLGVNTVMRASDVPSTVPGYDEVWAGDDDWMSRGRSAIVGPRGEILAGPLVEEEGILYADLDLAYARSVRVEFDAVGHYSRPDVFQLTVLGGPMATDGAEDAGRDGAAAVTRASANGKAASSGARRAEARRS
jgi:nitrilase